MTATGPTPRGSRPDGVSLAPFRGLRPRADEDRLGRLLSPPYDVIDASLRDRLLSGDPDNAVAVVLPEPTPAGYAAAAERLDAWVADRHVAVDPVPALYVYEMAAGGHVTRGIMGAVELRDPDDNVILPHENTMAGPVADRLQVMTATGTDLEPIYLVYDGGGAASEVVRTVGSGKPDAQATTADGTTHRLWLVTDETAVRDVASDLATRKALIADGHHRYATYRERQRLMQAEQGPGPWDRGLALLVDTTEYGPQVHAIHRVVVGMALDEARRRLEDAGGAVESEPPLAAALERADREPGFAVTLADGETVLNVTDPKGALAERARDPAAPAALAGLDVTVVHRGIVEGVWDLPDDVETVGYAHSVEEAIEAARRDGGIAVLMRPTPVAAVAGVAAAGARMPRKSTLFTPKPASGLVMRRLADQG